MIPCEQAVTIAKIETTLDNVVTLLEKHEDRDSRMLDAMETIAGQTEAIKYNHESLIRHEKSIDELFTALRAHLSEKDNANITCKIMNSNLGIYILYAVCLGLIIDIVYHKDLIMKLWNILF